MSLSNSPVHAQHHSDEITNECRSAAFHHDKVRGRSFFRRKFCSQSLPSIGHPIPFVYSPSPNRRDSLKAPASFRRGRDLQVHVKYTSQDDVQHECCWTSDLLALLKERSPCWLTDGFGGAIFRGPPPPPPLSTAWVLTGGSSSSLTSDSCRLLRPPPT